MSASPIHFYNSSHYPNQSNICEEPDLFIQQTNGKIAALNDLKIQIIALSTFAVLSSFVFYRAARSLYLVNAASDLLKGQAMVSGFFTVFSIYAGFSKLTKFLSEFQETKKSIDSYPKGMFHFQEKITLLDEEQFAEIRACFPENFDLRPILSCDKISSLNIQGSENRWGTFRLLAIGDRVLLAQDPGKFKQSSPWIEALLWVVRAAEIPLLDKQAFIREMILILDPENSSPFASLPSSQNIACQKCPSGSNWLIQFRYGSNTVFCDPKTLKKYLEPVYRND